MATHKTLHFVFGLFGNINGLLLFLAPTITFKKIIFRKSTQDFSGVPYVVTLLNCLVTGWYGIITPGNLLVTTVNAAGASLELTYVLIFLAFGPEREKLKIFGLLTIVLSIFGAVALISKLVFHDYSEHQRVFCGVAATMSAISMYASPFSVMMMVVRTKSTEFMPFFLSLFVFFCGTSWFIFGLLGKDVFLTVSNGLGSGLGAMQLFLFAIYRNNKNDDKHKISTNGLPNIELSPAYFEKNLDLKLSTKRPI